MEIVLSIFLGLLAILLCVSLYFNIKFGLIILRIQDSIEQSLDSLDDRYASISKILEIPLYYDSPEIRQVMLDIVKTRDTILSIAQSLGAAVENSKND